MSPTCTPKFRHVNTTNDPPTHLADHQASFALHLTPVINRHHNVYPLRIHPRLYYPLDPAPTMAGFDNLPNELLCMVIDYLDEGDLSALARTDKLLHSLATPVLLKTAGQDRLRNQQVLFWATENSQHGVMKAMLELNGDANACYWSPVLRSRLLSARRAARAQHRPAPKTWRDIGAECLRDQFCRSRQLRLGIMDALDGRTHDLSWDALASRLSTVDFGLEPGSLNHVLGPQVYTTAGPLSRQAPCWEWFWRPIHIAASLNDVESIKLLLAHGANIDAQSLGFCDCIFPVPDQSRVFQDRKYRPFRIDQDKETILSPGATCPVWTPLHIAICHDNPSAVRALLSAGARARVGGIKPTSTGAQEQDPSLRAKKLEAQLVTINAFQSAAWCGSTRVFNQLMDEQWMDDKWRTYVATCDPELPRSALALAASSPSGNFQEVGRAMMECGAVHPTRHYRHTFTALCREGKYDDLVWFIQYCFWFNPPKGAQLVPFSLLVMHTSIDSATSWKLSLRQCQD